MPLEMHIDDGADHLRYPSDRILSHVLLPFPPATLEARRIL